MNYLSDGKDGIDFLDAQETGIEKSYSYNITMKRRDTDKGGVWRGEKS